MLRHGQFLAQRQALQQRLSPQQIQFIKLLQLPTQALELRVKEELEVNPLLEEAPDWDEEADPDAQPAESETPVESDTTDPVDDNREIDWESFLHDDEPEGYAQRQRTDDTDWRELPKPYLESLLEDLERQVSLLDLDEAEMALAEQILGSIDDDGYLRRDLQAIADAVAFHTGHVIRLQQAERVLRLIQRLDPPAMGSRNLRECLLIQLEALPHSRPGRDDAFRIVDTEWDHFEKKHFEKIRKKLDLDEAALKRAYDLILTLDPKPGGAVESDLPTAAYVVPDFVVEPGPDGDFIITLHARNVPPLRVSPDYKRMWDENRGDQETRQFIRQKLESAKWFIDSIRQRQQTLLNVMRTIVALQEPFFRTGEGTRPMILKDVAERIGMDISTVSRVVNGKYVLCAWGVYELKYFFNEGLETDSGEEVSNREVKNLLAEIIGAEDKTKPLSDDALAEILAEKGFRVARRTVTKYREQLDLPVARLRKQVL